MIQLLKVAVVDMFLEANGLGFLAIVIPAFPPSCSFLTSFPSNLPAGRQVGAKEETSFVKNRSANPTRSSYLFSS